MYELTLGDPNWKLTMWPEIYDRARKKNKIIHATIGLYDFEYVLLNSADNYERLTKKNKHEHYTYLENVNYWIKDAEKEGEVGFMYAGKSFVVERNVPVKEFQNYVGLHEYIELKKGDHGAACKSELEEVLKKDNEFITQYAEWLITIGRIINNPKNGYFRAIPEFHEVVMNETIPAIDIIKEYKRQLDQKFQ